VIHHFTEERIMEFIIGVVQKATGEVLLSLAHNWPFLAASILIAAAIKAFVDSDKIARKLTRYKGVGIFAATAAAVATPLCSCGTTAIVLGMMASTMPWAPIVAFMVASPLSSPEGMIYSAGLFGWPFAVYSFAASIVLGLAGGCAAAILEKKGYLRGQARFSEPLAAPTCGCSEPAPAKAPVFTALRVPASPSLALAPAGASPASCGCGSAPPEPAPSSTMKDKFLALPGEAWLVARKLMPMFDGFAFIGFLLNGLVPSSWIGALFGRGHAYSVPLAATIGLPLYLNAEASLPMARALLDSGMSQGAIMAFLIAGSGTSMGAIAGALTIARWRVVGLVVAVLWIGAMLAGYGFDLIVAAGLAA
jgi:uncharacterized protein